MRYAQPKPGQWVVPKKRGYKMACCDCGLVHKMDFDHIAHGKGRKVIFRAWRDGRATAAMRRKKHIRIQWEAGHEQRKDKVGIVGK